jgi:hypothetical protein
MASSIFGKSAAFFSLILVYPHQQTFHNFMTPSRPEEISKSGQIESKSVMLSQCDSETFENGLLLDTYNLILNLKPVKFFVHWLHLPLFPYHFRSFVLLIGFDLPFVFGVHFHGIFLACTQFLLLSIAANLQHFLAMANAADMGHRGRPMLQHFANSNNGDCLQYMNN